MRIGMGYDVHRLVPDRKLIIGGVLIPHDLGLLGHSDADVLLHAIMDSLLGAAALGDIGKHFPDTDEKYKGISSLKLLEHVGKLINETDYKIISPRQKVYEIIDSLNICSSKYNDNFLYITGRKKNIIILSNGENISPEEIESVLGNDKGVCEVIVFSKNNKLVASIYPNEEYIGDQEYFDNLVYQYNKKMPKNRQIALVLLRTEEFPKNNNKKIVRSKVEESLWKMR